MKKNYFSLKESWEVLHKNLGKNVVLATIFLFVAINLQAQTISQTGIRGGSSSGTPCGTCTPDGWNIETSSTPDMSTRTTAGGGTTGGAGATWVNSPLPLPPVTNNNMWVTMRDLGPSFAEESISTQMGSLIAGKIYKLTLYSMSAVSNQDGNSSSYYAGTHMDKYDYQIDSNAKQSITNLSQDVWRQDAIIFIAQPDGSGEMKLILYPGNNGAGNTNSRQGYEPLHIAVELNAVEVLDSDGDGIDNIIDLDDDNDGILDTVESGAYNPEGDEDGDQLPNYLDNRDDGTGDGSATNYTDSNSDGIPDVFDYDNDGIPNHLDLDTDNDGIPDNIEAQTTTGYIAPSGGVGNNGVYASYENNDTQSATALTPVNTDGADTPDFFDLDADNDGYNDVDEAGVTLSNPINVGVNGLDSTREIADNYTDVNGLFDNTQLDNFPNTNGTEVDWRNPTTSGGFNDNDGDGIINSIDIDDDNDGITDIEEGMCVTPTSPNWATFPSANSGTVNNNGGTFTYNITKDASFGYGAVETYTGFSQGIEIFSPSNSTDPDSFTYTLNLSSVTSGYDAKVRLKQRINQTSGNDEASLWTISWTGGTGNATYHDNITPSSSIYKAGVSTPFDINNREIWGLATTGEITNGGTFSTYMVNNIDSQWYVDFPVGVTSVTINKVVYTGSIPSGSGVIDGGFPNTSPSDGQGDNGTSYNEWIGLQVELSTCNDRDTDNDGIPDYRDLDSDNDGIPDNIEAQTTAGYIPPTGSVGANGMYDVYDSDDTTSATGLTPVNTDGTDNPDYLDLNSDNDASGDTAEAQLILSGVVGANGLDNNYDNGDNYTDVNGSFSNTATDFPNLNGVGDVDWRDATSVSLPDNDNDGIPDTTDIDDDNDGISDAQELCDAELTNGATINVYIDLGAYEDENGWTLTNTTGGVIQSVAQGTYGDSDDIINLNFNVTALGDYTFTITDSQGDGLDTNASGGSGGSSNENAQAFYRITLNGGAPINTVTPNPSFSSESTTITVTASDLAVKFPCLNEDPSADADNDGIPNYKDPQFNTGVSGDTINSNGVWSSLDDDGDGKPNHFDLDSDNDGIPDNIEAQTTAGFVAPTGSVGANGMYDVYDSSDSLDASGLTPTNTDGTDEPDYKDTNSDNDAATDIEEANTILAGNVGYNGLDNNYDNSDNYTNVNGIFSGPTDFPDTNPGGDRNWRDASTTGQPDRDNDGVPDNTDLDDDNDGILDTDEGAAFCSTTTNTTNTASASGAKDFDLSGFGYVAGDKIRITAVNSRGDFDGNQANEHFSLNFNDGESVTGNLQSTAECGSTLATSTGFTPTVLTVINTASGFAGIKVTGTIGSGVNTTNAACANIYALSIQCVEKNNSRDTDGDGIPDYLDIDSDNDGISDNIEAQTSAGYIAPTGGVGNNGVYDVYDSNDTSSATALTPIDSDGDGIKDYLDLDTDNDGIPDNIEAQTTTGYIAPTGGLGVNGAYASYENNDTLNATLLTPFNKDGTDEPDYRDTDSDNDGLSDTAEAGLTLSGVVGVNGFDDDYDVNDGYADVNGIFDNTQTDNFPDSNGNVNTGGDVDWREIPDKDTDGDGIFDSVDLDDDNDGILDINEGCNSGGLTWGDHFTAGTSDVTSGQNLSAVPTINLGNTTYTYSSQIVGTVNNQRYRVNSWKAAFAPHATFYQSSSALDWDTNYSSHTITFSNPVRKLSFTLLDIDIDPDLERVIIDIVDQNNNSYFLTPADIVADGHNVSGNTITGTVASKDKNVIINPLHIAVKSITLRFGTDYSPTGTASGVAFGLSNLTFCVPTDTDGDGIIDSLDLDSDNDGISDLIESGNTQAIAADTNNDGTISNAESPAGANGVPLAAEGGTEGGTVPDPVNTDGTGGADPYDLDSDNDGIHDLTEGLPIATDVTTLDSNNDGVLDGTTDADNDGIIDIKDTNTSQFGGLTDVTPDIDSDGTKDFRDLDTDGDGISDIAEGGNGTLDTNNDGIVDNTTDTDGDGIADSLDSNNSVFGDPDTALPNADNDNTPVIPDFRDLDSDNDGINDVEEATGGVDANGDGLMDNSTLISNPGTAYTTVNGTALTGNDGDNDGILDQVDGLPLEYGDFPKEDLMITQIYRADDNVAVELTNIGTKAIAIKHIILVASSSDITGEIYRFAPTTNTSSLQGGKSLLVVSKATLTGVTFTNTANERIVDASLSTIIPDATMFRLTAGGGGTEAFNNAYDATPVYPTFKNNTSYVRADFITKPFKPTLSNFITGETSINWVRFVDDAIPAYGDNTAIAIDMNTQRHQHAPLLSEVKTPNLQANNGLGVHRVNPTHRTGGVWNNGYPDRSRYVFIDENYTHTAASLNARRFEVTGTSVLSVGNQLLKVTDSTTIADNAQLRMLGKSQFIQTHEGSENIIGNGKLLIDQHSNINVAESIYRYNYWSSPVVEAGTTTYRVGEVMKDGTTALSPISTIKDINFTASTYNGSTTNPITIANYWIWTFYNNTSRNDWEQKRNTGSIDRGKGYTMKGTGYVGTTGQNYTFVGTPNDGEFGYAMNENTTSLMGNPYAGSLDANTFIKENEGTIKGELYFWEHTGATDLGGYVEQHGKNQYQGGYSMRNLSMGVAANSLTLSINTNHQSSGQTIGTGGGTYHEPSRYIALAQGFFVCAHSNGNIKFTNKQRAIDDINNPPYFFKGATKNKDAKKESTLPILKLGFEYFNENDLGIHRQVGLSFDVNHSFEYDYGFDSEIFDTQPTDIYFKFPEMDKKLIVAGVQAISEDLEVPVAVNIVTDKSVFIMVDVKKNISQPLYLLDKVTGISYSLEEPVELNLAKGTYSDRFYIAFKQSSSLHTNNDELLDTAVAIAMNNTTKELEISQNNTEINKIELYNLIGQKVQNWGVTNSTKSTHNLKVSNLPNGAYVVKVYTNKGIVSKKVVHLK